MPQSYSALYNHFIFSTKDRIPMIDATIQARLYDYVGGLVKARECVLLAAGGVQDHVHLLCSMSREISPAVFVRDIKANSTGWLHRTFPRKRDFAWQEGYGVFSVSYSNLPAVNKYIADQAEHHRKKSFQEEFIEFLKRHELEYDERYIWK